MHFLISEVPLYGSIPSSLRIREIVPTDGLPEGPRDFIPAGIQFEYDPDDLAPKVTTRMVRKSQSKTDV